MDQEHIDYKDDDLQPGWPWSIGITKGQVAIYVFMAVLVAVYVLAYWMFTTVDDL
jgi:hypothetical protein